MTNFRLASVSGLADAFGRLRVASPITIFDSTLVYDLQATWWLDVVNNGSVTHQSNLAAARLSTGGTTTGNYAYRQTRSFFQYQPGKSQCAMFTGTIGAATTNVRKRLGLFYSENGLFFEQTGSGLGVVQRSFTSGAVVDTRVEQADWNIDRMDGTGVSGVLLDVTKSQIMTIDFEWLGVGQVRFGFIINGTTYYVHRFLNANSITTAYMSTPHLPVRFEIENTATALSTGTLDVNCVMLVSEGGTSDPGGYTFSRGSATGLSVSTRRAVLSIRPAALFATKVNRTVIAPRSINLTAATQGIYYEIVYNPTYTGTPTWTAVDALSGVEYSVHGDAAAGAITAGKVISSGFLVAGGATGDTAFAKEFQPIIPTRWPLTLDIAGANPTALAIVATSLTGTASVHSSIDWNEYR